VRVAVIIVGLLLAAAVATYVRYESLDPCDWLARDLMVESGLPRMAVDLRISAAFLLDGVTDPDTGDCLVKWWAWRRDGVPLEE
jgi:hypothetical protein